MQKTSDFRVRIMRREGISSDSIAIELSSAGAQKANSREHFTSKGEKTTRKKMQSLKRYTRRSQIELI